MGCRARWTPSACQPVVSNRTLSPFRPKPHEWTAAACLCGLGAMCNDGCAKRRPTNPRISNRKNKQTHPQNPQHPPEARRVNFRCLFRFLAVKGTAGARLGCAQNWSPRQLHQLVYRLNKLHTDPPKPLLSDTSPTPRKHSSILDPRNIAANKPYHKTVRASKTGR